MTSSMAVVPELKFKFSAHQDRITDMKEAKEGEESILYTSSRDKTIKAWKFVRNEQGELSSRLCNVYKGHNWFINGIEVVGNGEYVISVGEDKMIKMWSGKRLVKNVKSYLNKKPKCILYHTYYTDMEMKNLVEYVFIGGDDGAVQVWNTKLEMKSKLVRPDNETSGVTSIKTIPKKPESIICAYEDGAMIIWNTETEQVENVMKGHSTIINAIKASPDGSLCATAGRDRKILLWDLKGQNNSYCQIAIDETVHCLDFAMSAYWLALGGDNSIIIWDIIGKDILVELPHPEGVRGPCTSLFWVNQTTLAAGYADGSVQYSYIKK